MDCLLHQRIEILNAHAYAIETGTAKARGNVLWLSLADRLRYS